MHIFIIQEMSQEGEDIKIYSFKIIFDIKKNKKEQSFYH